MWWIKFIDFQMLYQPCIPKLNFTSWWYTILLMHGKFDLLIFCWGFLHPCSRGVLICSFIYYYAVFILWFLCQVLVCVLKASKEGGKCSPLSVFWKRLHAFANNSSLNVWKHLLKNHLGQEFSSCEDCWKQIQLL